MSNKLYFYPLTIWLTRENRGVGNINYSMNDNDFKVHKNSRSDVQFVVRDIDRKPIILKSKSLRIVVVNPDNNEVILDKPLEILNEIKGLAKVIIEDFETADWQLGYYDYSVHITNEDDSEVPLFVDRDRNASSYFELMPSLIPSGRRTKELEPRKFFAAPYGLVPDIGGDTRLVSSAYRGDLEMNFTGTPSHKFVIRSKDFTGRLYMQFNNEQHISGQDGGREDEENLKNADWMYITLDETTPQEFLFFSTVTGTTNLTINQSFRWFRFHIQPIFNNKGEIFSITHQIQKLP